MFVSGLPIMSQPFCSIIGRMPSGPAAESGSNSAMALPTLLSEKIRAGSHAAASGFCDEVARGSPLGGAVVGRLSATVTQSLKCVWVKIFRVSSGDSVSFPSGSLTVPSLVVLLSLTIVEIFFELDFESISEQKVFHVVVLAFFTSFLYSAW